MVEVLGLLGGLLGTFFCCIQRISVFLLNFGEFFVQFRSVETSLLFLASFRLLLGGIRGAELNFLVVLRVDLHGSWRFQGALVFR